MTPTLHRYILPVEVTGVHRHSRTVSGHRTKEGFTAVTNIDLGWHVHIDMAGEELTFACGPDRPPFHEGETVDLVLEKRTGSAA